MTGDDRAQAFTLEGVVGALLVLSALLFSLQAVVLTPTASGTVDPLAREQLRTEAEDALATTAADGSLSALVRYWNATNDTANATFAYAYAPAIGYGTAAPCTTAPDESPCESVGQTLKTVFADRGFVYNLYVTYRNESDPRETERERVVYRGVPPDNAVTATYTVTLYDDQHLTAPGNASDVPLAALAADDEFYAADVSSGHVFNVVEVRLVVW